MNDLILQLFEKYPVLFTVLNGLLAAHLLAQFIVNLTPTPRDDKIVGKVYRVVEWVAGVTNQAKALPGEDKTEVQLDREARRNIRRHRDTFTKEDK